MADRIDVREGNFFVDDLPGGDLYALARTLHDWEEEKVCKLLNLVSERRRPRGRPRSPRSCWRKTRVALDGLKCRT